MMMMRRHHVALNAQRPVMLKTKVGTFCRLVGDANAMSVETKVVTFCRLVGVANEDTNRADVCARLNI